MKHTSTPWVFNFFEMKIKGTGDVEGRTVIANLSANMDYTRGWNTQCANAQRIIACVNALEGIEDPQQFVDVAKSHIESSALEEAHKRVSSLIEENISLIDARNNLLTAIGNLMKQHEELEKLVHEIINEGHFETAEALNGENKVKYRTRLNSILGIAAGGGA